MTTPIITDKHAFTITFSSNNLFETNFSSNLVLAANNTVLANTPGIVPSSTISNIVVLGGKTRFSELTDVRTTGEQDGDTVIFNQANGTYNVTTFNLDSGEF